MTAHRTLRFLLTSIVAFLAILACAVPASALHPRPVGALEGEARVGISFPLGGYRNGEHNESAALGLAGRWNFRNTGWDAGLAANLSCAERRFGEFHEDTESSQNNRTVSIMAVGHFNFNQGGKFNPFAGVGVGAAYCDVVGTRVYPLHGWYAAVAPCLGMEFVSHARITMQFNLARKGFNNITISFGAVLGGKEKKR